MWLFTSLLPFALLSYNIIEASLPTWYTTRRHDNYNHYAIKINEFITPTEVSNLLDLEYVGSLDNLEGYHLFATHKNNPVQVENFLHNTLQKRQNHPSRHIKHIYKESLRKRTKRAPIPPPKNHTGSQVHQVFDIAELKDPGFPKQWHLHNEDNVGNDLNILKVWQQGIFGNNVVVALLDDGLDMNSEDLKDNYFAEGSYDFNDHSPVPSPKLSDDYHGTRCAGEIAATNNSVCGVGVAFGSKVSGIRILSDTISDLDEALALLYENQKNHIYSCSWGPSDDGFSMDGPSKMINDALVSGVTKGRGEKGSIFVFATGNGGAYNDNCNFDGYANSIYTISIGAIDRYDQQPNYSEQCSAQLAVTYSSGANGEGIYTTDVGQSKCTDTHGGTSAAAPLAAGIFALVLSVRPDLHWRDIQHLAVRTAQPFSPNDPDWKSTVSGRKFNHKYGYGKLDAYRIVEASKTYDSVGPQVQFSSGLLKVDQLIPSDSTGVRQSFTISTETAQNHFLNLLEHVTVTVDISHQRRGDVEVYLTSPNNVTSVLSPGRQLDESEEGFKNWTFMSVKHWDESVLGTWTLTVKDSQNPDKVGSLHSWTLNFFGAKYEPVVERSEENEYTETPLNPNPTSKIPTAANPLYSVIGLIGSVTILVVASTYRLRGNHVAEDAYMVLQNEDEDIDAETCSDVDMFMDGLDTIQLSRFSLDTTSSMSYSSTESSESSDSSESSESDYSVEL